VKLFHVWVGVVDGGMEGFMAYTQDGIMAQIYVAFGQGTGAVRVSQDVCTALHARYHSHIDAALVKDWETQGVQVLERIRAIGRLMAINAGLAGKTNLVGADVDSAARTVERQSGTPFCPPY
jgi:hypothetical protein